MRANSVHPDQMPCSMASELNLHTCMPHYGKYMYPKILSTKIPDKMAYTNSADPDQTAPEGAV